MAAGRARDVRRERNGDGSCYYAWATALRENLQEIHPLKLHYIAQ
jgi:hypothetical protein